MSNTVAERLDQLFSPWNRNDAPGLAVGVCHEGRVIYRRGFGMASLETSVALTPTSKLRIGSTTKHFTALLGLLLAEAGKLDFDVPIRTYLPELAGPGGDPSIRQLLQHRGGSRCYLDIGFIAHGMATTPRGRAFEIQALQKGRNFQPGEAVIYNNGGYQLVTHAIERAGGAPFEQQLKARLLDPLGMRNTSCVVSDHVIVPGMATLHVANPEGGWRRGLFPTEEVLGEGGIVSTVDDMLIWLAHLRSRDRFGTPKTWHALYERPVFPDGHVGSYALGMMLGDYRGLKVVHHAGGVIGGTSQMLTFPEDGLDVVILVNGGPAADPVALAERVADIVLEGRLGAMPGGTDAGAHADLVGDWWSPETGMIYNIMAVEGTLRLGICGSPPYPLRPIGGGKAVVAIHAIGDIEVDLNLDDRGQAAIRFGGATTSYRRLEGGSSLGAFGLKAVGRYRSNDANCTARIATDGTATSLVFNDAFGTSSLDVKPLSPSVAIASRDVGGRSFTIAVSLQPDGGLVMNTGRTRNLRFDRID